MRVRKGVRDNKILYFTEIFVGYKKGAVFPYLDAEAAKETP